MRAVIVTGSRRWWDRDAIDKALQLAWDESKDVLASHAQLIVVHGACKGADEIASAWCRSNHGRGGIFELPMPADWKTHGPKAGPLRNQRMLDVLLGLRDCGYYISVEAFPLSTSVGTLDMIKRASKWAIEINVHKRARC